nr:hypothetical protein [Curtobacterium flaccumfaciens]WQM79122.1 hypothetical protein PCFP21_350 [Curtobacterium flaccumfaciens pv. poinsettiae]WQM79180.1 trypsin-like serine protease [Curtobacterium flaccumfaciens pv. poinsettiae]WQM79259.1 hypothetical protein PCFP24_045 [Curtobacterium flaccumfaciens pv. poinsettiae]WQM79431.1 hypothetical protein PCFP11_420 [Curtobacterium flaccumfaciens pv. poinsettiae]WQM79466.1 hypothetical protein PCFP31_160 [Curtobacterium flaccumfaciens pv. poinsett
MMTETGTMITWEPFATWATALTWILLAVSIGLIVCLLALVVLRLRGQGKDEASDDGTRRRRASIAQPIGGVLGLLVGIINGIPVVAREFTPIYNSTGTTVSFVLIAASLLLLAQGPSNRQRAK